MTLSPAATEPLLLDRDGPVATLTINRPERLNALTFAMFARLPVLLAEAAAAGGVRALVLRGAGTKSFSAGADISEFESTRSTILMAGTEVDARRAAELGLVDEVHDGLDEAVREFTSLLATRSGVTQRAVKSTIARILDGVTTDDADHAELRAAALAAPDYAEGVRAFLERRPPVFE